MSVALIRSNSVRKLVAVVCLLTFTAAAQQGGNVVALQAAGGRQAGDAAPQPPSASTRQQTAGQPGAQTPSAPEPKSLTLPPSMDFSKPAPLLPNPFARYIPRSVPQNSFANGPKIESLIQNGKLMLSLDDAISIALADNLDIAIFRYNLSIAGTDILRTKAGNLPLGTASGVVQNTPGGGVGGIGGGVSGTGAGGTTAGAGGAGAGAAGIVSTTSGAGPGAPNYDPVLNATFQIEHATSPVANPFIFGGVPVLQQNTGNANFSYIQGFSPGTNLVVTLANSRQTTNSPFSTFNPGLNGSFRATVTQHLLQGFGRKINMRFIRQAKNNQRITEQGFRNQVISTVSQIQTIYWNLVNAYEDVKVKERSLALAQKTLSDNQKQVQIGTLAPLDVVRAQSQVASAEQDLIISRTNLQLQELTIKNALTRDLSYKSPLMQSEVVPTDTIQLPEDENLASPEDLIQQALANRPDYIQQKINLKNAEINMMGANNAVLPTVDLFGFYGASSLAGVENPLLPNPAGIPTTGYGDALSNLFNSSAPDKGVGVVLSIPLGNRAAQATQIRSRLEYRQSQLSLKQVENAIAIQIRNDVFTVQQNRARVAAAQKARELAAQTLDAEQKKYNLGASTYLNVMQDERDLAQAESALVTAMTNYAISKVTMDKDTAQTLEKNNIVIDEAITGNVKTQPHVPGVVPNPSVLQDINAAPGSQPIQLQPRTGPVPRQPQPPAPQNQPPQQPLQ